MNVAAFWGLPESATVCPAAGAIVGRWETVQVQDPELLCLSAPATVLLPERRAVGTGTPILHARLGSGESVPLAVRTGDGTVELAFDPDAAIATLTSRSAHTPGRPLAARMPFNYRRVPAPVRNAIRVLMTRRRAAALDAGWPAWPYEPSVEILRAIYLAARRALEPGLAPTPFWPDGRRFAVAITHDVDSAAGLQRARELAMAEAARGHRACYYVVGLDYALEPGAMAALHAAGAEVGLHGPHHDNQIAFLQSAQAVAQLDACAETIAEHRMRGFRSPSMLRTPRLYRLLAERFAYDSSMPDTGLLPARNGCATVFPLGGELSILPLTLPPDGQLLGRGLGPDAVLAAWIAKAEWIAELGGVAVHLTHPEPGFSADAPMRQAHERFLDWVDGREDAWRATPAEIVDHWRARVA